MGRIYDRHAREVRMRRLSYAPALVACKNLGVSYHELQGLVAKGKVRSFRDRRGDVVFDIVGYMRQLHKQYPK
jgi:hypothetical protein